MKDLKIVLVENNKMLIEGYNMLLNTVDIGIKKVFHDGVSFLHWIEKTRADDIVVINDDLLDFNGIEILNYLHKKRLNQKVILVSEHNTAAYIKKAIQLGCMGFILLKCMTDIQVAIENIASGKRYFSDEIIRDLILSTREEKLPDTMVRILTKEDIDFIKLLAKYSPQNMDMIKKIRISDINFGYIDIEHRTALHANNALLQLLAILN
ncbi:response regulator [Tenacibaculum sp. SG-28]|uniref:response regulator n=1 Tax=Tenacibaculum sp. SG-28 TaxID=754426 RepID=UPI000CF43D0F|nr:response regulator [Tenacibaculum sp. SG-28]PQJ23270.1 hypothetical protein BSU00_03395 [Tenacibaculum sp. SG-28]